MERKTNVAIIGGGPGGYVAAIRASQLGKQVVLVEKDKIGGTCMNYGCIPSKYLLQQTKVFKEIKQNSNLDGPTEEIQLNWKKVQKEKVRVVHRLRKGTEFLLKKSGIQVIPGTAWLEDKNKIKVRTEEEEYIIQAQNIILATGSSSAELSFLKMKNDRVITSQETLELEQIPKNIIIVGAGAVGLEMGTMLNRMGCEVLILEVMPTILPGSDKEMVNRLGRILKAQGIKIHTQMKIQECYLKGNNIFLKGIHSANQKPFELEAEMVLLAAGRKPNSEQFKRKNAPEINISKKGFVQVNPFLETSVSGIFAVGDLIGGPMLAHKASHEGILAVENMDGARKRINYQALPLAVFTDPEFSCVGLTEEGAQERGIKYKKGLFSLQANGRAVTMDKGEGMVKVITDNKDKIIGAHILSPHASELIPELTLGVRKELKIQEISSSIHIHPTISEAIMEGALKTFGECIHMLNK